MVRILIATDIRFYREGLAEILNRYDDFHVVATASCRADVTVQMERAQPQVVLLDSAMPESHRTTRVIAETSAATAVLVLAVPETERDILACAEAGACGFVPRDASIKELVKSIRSALQGELRCSPRVASTLMRRVWKLARGSKTKASAAQSLTARQREILELVDEGLANKEIAQRLHIGLPTVKNHVHNILEKLRVRNRRQAAALFRSA